MTDISLQKTTETAKRARGGPFPKDQSGNPAGRPRGSSNRATGAAETNAVGWYGRSVKPRGVNILRRGAGAYPCSGKNR